MAKLKRKDYGEAMEPLAVELNRLQRWLAHTGQRMIVLFEGRDTAGKGGVIKAISGCLNPRSCRVVALSKPTERESSQWYFQRYVSHLPAAGELVLFDRSWYNRAGVEKVMGFCTEEQHRRFLEECPVFERQLVNDGIILLKYWLGCDQSKQEERFAERIEDPVKRWKISSIDLASRKLYDDYTRARDEMLKATHTSDAPWALVDMNDQKQGRLDAIRHLLDQVADIHVEPEAIELPALPKAASKERYPKGVPKVKRCSWD